MMFGTLNDAQRATLKPFLQGAHVHDLGSGNLELAAELLILGAARVTAVDKAYKPQGDNLQPPQVSSRVQLVDLYFSEYVVIVGGIDVAFMSWPDTYKSHGLDTLARLARRVIYLGSNLDGTACGRQELFEHFLHRELLAHVPSPTNTLLVYGEPRDKRQPVAEEYAALTRDTSPIVRYAEAYGDP